MYQGPPESGMLAVGAVASRTKVTVSWVRLPALSNTFTAAADGAVVFDEVKV